MEIPSHVLQCIQILEDASFPAYLVGGCVRDHLLGLPPHDFDLCTAATPEQMQALFSGFDLVLAGLKHGTVGVICHGNVVEITTFRTEGDYSDHRHPGWVQFVTEIDQDLSRRDFTVNAMAYSPTRGFADPFGGQEDLKNRTLRAVGDPKKRFTEDPLRILRGVRFAVKYRLDIDTDTEKAMHATAPLMDNLARERVFDELCKLLPLVSAEDLLRYTPILTQVIPELAPTVGFDQHSPHHAYELFTHIAHAVEATPAELTLRWAALLHDVGKVPTFTRDENGRGHFYGHARESAKLANEILLRLKAPTALREQVVQLVELHMTRLIPDKKLLRRRLSRYGEEAILQLLALQEADMGSKGTGNTEESEQYRQIWDLLEEIKEENSCLTIKDLTVNGKDLLTLGYTPGKELGACLQSLLDQVLDEQISNNRDALLTAAKDRLEQLET